MTCFSCLAVQGWQKQLESWDIRSMQTQTLQKVNGWDSLRFISDHLQWKEFRFISFLLWWGYVSSSIHCLSPQSCCITADKMPDVLSAWHIWNTHLTNIITAKKHERSLNLSVHKCVLPLQTLQQCLSRQHSTADLYWQCICHPERLITTHWLHSEDW